jgi:hypothetical protein
MRFAARDCRRNARPIPRLAPEKTPTCPKHFQTLARFRGDNRVNEASNTGGKKMRFLVSTLFGRSDAKVHELDAFMRRLDRIAMERSKTVIRRIA